MANAAYPGGSGTIVNNSNAATFIPEIWSDEIVAAYKKNLVAANLFKKINDINHKNAKDYIFKYNNRRINADDVNSYLMDKLKVNITTKDLRTWNANYLFNKYLHKCKYFAWHSGDLH